MNFLKTPVKSVLFILWRSFAFKIQETELGFAGLTRIPFFRQNKNVKQYKSFPAIPPLCCRARMLARTAVSGGVWWRFRQVVGPAAFPTTEDFGAVGATEASGRNAKAKPPRISHAHLTT